jgi:hypothetical protein
MPRINNNSNNNIIHYKSRIARIFDEDWDKYYSETQITIIKGDSVTHPYHTCPNCGHTFAE